MQAPYLYALASVCGRVGVCNFVTVLQNSLCLKCEHTKFGNTKIQACYIPHMLVYSYTYVNMYV